jgi:hypothetical protein
MDVQLIVSLPLYYSNKSIVLVPQYYVIVLMLYTTAIMYHMLFRCILYTSFYNYNNNNNFNYQHVEIDWSRQYYYLIVGNVYALL